MRLHPVTWLFLLYAALKTAALCIQTTELGVEFASLLSDPSTRAEDALQALAGPLGWMAREFAEAGAAAAWAFWIEGLVRVHRHLVAWNGRAAEGEVNV